MSEPIHSPEAEKAILTALLTEPNRVADDTFDALDKEDFFSPVNKMLFDQMMQMHNSGIHIDPMLLVSRLEDKKLLASAGGHSGIWGISESGVSIATINHNIKIVKGKATLRKLVKASEVIAYSCEDRSDEPEEVLQEAEHLIQEIADSRPKHGTLYTAKESARLCLKRLEEVTKIGSGLRGPSTGIPELDKRIFGLEKKKFIVIGARTNVGKTYLAQTIIKNLCRAAVPCDLISCESETEDLSNREVSMLSGIPLDDIQKGGLTSRQIDLFSVALQETSQWPRNNYCVTAPSIYQIRSIVRKLIRIHAPKVIIIDYLGLLKAKAENRREEISQISRGLQALSRECPDTCLIVLAQLNRDPEKDKDGEPQLHHLKDSGQIEQDADIVLLLHRKMRDDGEYSYDECSIKIAKGRNVKKGRIAMLVDADTGEWTQKPYY